MVYSVQKKVHSLPVHVLVFCMDQRCMEISLGLNITAFAAYKHWQPPLLWNVKLRGLSEVVQVGNPVVFLDLDVYIVADPFLAMLPLESTSWDIQFQRDCHAPCEALNIGWFFMKSTPPTVHLWSTALSLLQMSDYKWWDQAIVNHLATNKTYTNNTSLRLHRLHLDAFPQLMLLDGKSKLYDASLDRLLDHPQRLCT
jgi:hypothetical protein